MSMTTLSELSQGLKQGNYSALELAQDAIRRIKQNDHHYRSMITISEDMALQQAAQADALLAAGNQQPLTGIPIAHKDLFCTKGVRTTAGSKMLETFTPPYESTVSQLLLNAGAVCVGKTNLDEFAMGSSNENSYFGKVHNPWDIQAVPGGSSGGSAAAVAAGFVPAATGTDTGGSIRQPAAFCNLTGLKPTYGRVSRLGIIAFASSLDQAGPMTHTAADAALMMNAIGQFDPQDSTSMQTASEDYTAHLNASLQGVKIGIPQEFFNSNVDDQVAQTTMDAIKHYQSLGAELVDVSLPNLHLSIPAYYIIAPCEASSNLARYDGVRYGYRCNNPQDLMDMYCRTRSEGFGEEVKRRIMVGTYALSEGFYDAYYLKAQRIRRIIKNDFLDVFNKVDVIMGPVTPSTAFKLGSKTDDPTAMYLEDIFTLGVNLAGLPALSTPAGFINDMPTGLHIIGNYFSESKLLNLAHQLQQVTDWHLQSPPTPTSV